MAVKVNLSYERGRPVLSFYNLRFKPTYRILNDEVTEESLQGLFYRHREVKAYRTVNFRRVYDRYVTPTLVEGYQDPMQRNRSDVLPLRVEEIHPFNPMVPLNAKLHVPKRILTPDIIFSYGEVEQMQRLWFVFAKGERLIYVQPWFYETWEELADMDVPNPYDIDSEEANTECEVEI